MVTLVIEAFYAVVFLRSLVAFLRHRSPVHRDVTLVFAPITLLFVLESVRRAQGVAALPATVGYVTTTALLAQPYLTMRLVQTLRPMPRWVMRLALCLFVVTTVPFYIPGQTTNPVTVLAAVLSFFGVQGVAAVLFVREAGQRTGAPRARLVLAAVGTATLGLCLLLAGEGAGSQPLQFASEALALLSGTSYVVAFLPPVWLRRIWASSAAYEIHHQIVLAPVDEPPGETWRRYATTVRESSGATAALVLLPSGAEPVCVAFSGDPPPEPLHTTAADLTEVLSRPQPVMLGNGPGGSALLGYAHRAGARTVVAVPLQLPGAGTGALVLLNRRYPMFAEDDARLLGELGAAAAVLSERGAAAEAVRSLNSQLERRVQERTGELRVAQAALEDVNRQLESQNRTLARSNEELQRFAYVASHDLQEPLRKIISFSGLLMERMPGELDPQTRMYVDRIVGSTARMQRLISDLLMFSRVGAAGTRQPVECGVALDAALDSLAVTLVHECATVTRDRLPIVVAARTPLEQVFQNLVGNAVKYRSQDPPRIHVGTQRLDGEWRLSVTDNGIGVDMAYADRIFQVFQRLHPRGQYDGTGIGLAVCKRIVESYGGRIGVDSVAGAGATFWFTLPAADVLTIEEAPDAVVQHAE